jgi:hypothetical protein
MVETKTSKRDELLRAQQGSDGSDELAEEEVRAAHRRGIDERNAVRAATAQRASVMPKLRFRKA